MYGTYPLVIAKALFEQFDNGGLKLITRYRQNMNNRLVPVIERNLFALLASHHRVC